MCFPEEWRYFPLEYADTDFLGARRCRFSWSTVMYESMVKGDAGSLENSFSSVRICRFPWCAVIWISREYDEVLRTYVPLDYLATSTVNIK
jgi:hypothetical protein